MRILDSKRCALGICAIAAILAGCAVRQAQGDTQPPLSAVQPGYQAQQVGHAAKGTIKVVYSFTVALTDNSRKLRPTTGGQDPNHDWPLIGTTTRGGDADSDGTVYGLRRERGGKWVESVLYTFGGTAKGDGSEPVGIHSLGQREWEMVSAASGGSSGNGALVGLSPNSSGLLTESFIYSFGGAPDGSNPWGAIITDKAGNIYGTTEDGGAYSSGTVYRMQSQGSSYTESVLYSFGGGSSDGAHPLSGLIIDKKGALYGTTEEGGSAGAGTVFKLTPSKRGYTESILYSFKGEPDGSKPESGIVASRRTITRATPTLYGTTVYGGANNDGTVYELTPSGKGYTETVVWNFGSVAGDGVDPTGGVCVNDKGVTYGTTLGGGSGASSGLGTFFTLTPSGNAYKESVESFSGANGAYPFAGPSTDSKGNLYVTGEAGGASNEGAMSTTGVKVTAKLKTGCSS